MILKLNKKEDKDKMAEEKQIKSNLKNKETSGQTSDTSQIKDSKSNHENLSDTNKQENLYEEIEIPNGISVEVIDDVLIMKKENKELRRKLNALISLKIKRNKVIISSNRTRRIEKRLFGTFKAHIKNIIKGLEEGFVYKLQVANVHFPMNVSYDKTNNELVVKNFLGEKKERRIRLVEGVDVKVDKENIEVSSHDIEKAGTAATQIEKGTKVRNKDRRIFQDGIFLVEKPGKVYV